MMTYWKVKGETPREELEDIKAFLAVLALFPELNDKNLFAVVGPGRFVSALKREVCFLSDPS